MHLLLSCLYYVLQDTSLNQALKDLIDTKNELTVTKASLDKENEQKKNSEPEKVEEEQDEEVFVYPSTTIEEQPNNNNEEEEEEEEVFVYRGMDAVVPEQTSTEGNAIEREEKLKAYYEQKISTLTEKIQLTDSKAYRFASMYKNLKEKLMKEDKEKELMIQEIERLNKEVKNVQDLLSTTESNYQKQIDTMTEFITSLQQNVEDRQYNRRSNNSYK